MDAVDFAGDGIAEGGALSGVEVFLVRKGQGGGCSVVGCLSQRQYGSWGFGWGVPGHRMRWLHQAGSHILDEPKGRGSVVDVLGIAKSAQARATSRKRKGVLLTDMAAEEEHTRPINVGVGRIKEGHGQEKVLSILKFATVRKQRFSRRFSCCLSVWADGTPRMQDMVNLAYAGR